MNSLKQHRSYSFLPKWVLFILVGAVIMGVLAVPGCTPSAQPIKNGQVELSQAPEVGRQAPDFTLTDLEGNSVTLSDFRGKVVFINFWASWCPPCRAEMPEMEAIYQEYKSQDVVVIGVDILEAADVVRQFVQQRGYSWTFVLDTTGAVTSSYGVVLIPTSFFLDKEGIIRAVNIGAMTKRAMESRLAEAMK